MKAAKIGLTAVLFLAAVAVGYAANPNMGTWKLNDAKSKFPARATRNATVIYTAEGDKIKVTTDGTSGDGKPVQTEWVGNFDGKDYPLTGDPNADSRCYKKISERVMELTNKKDGKPVTTGRITISADGKSRTLKVTTTGADGKKMTYTAMYDKQ